MRVKLLTHRVGDGFDQPIGTVIDVPKREALALLNAGSAEPVGNTRRIETATLDRSGLGRRKKGPQNATDF